ncbi:basic helix-loop-helix (bHLH) DNA-binding superfamily protein [Rhynchospora pubera]|uniref:Basic helix-loop-helix (BHLH) DNA-binding superfamily protein n=1 Tax=Rhynchospora pubera TaxID=906938 RepID=A0AAV8EBE3_9POAL|nr:basic helix-loop-helix (bHLH) DNA-binding superfamily protein [Rhynchospora pubera]
MMMTQGPNHKRSYSEDYLYFSNNNNTDTNIPVDLDFDNTMASKRLKSVTGAVPLPPKEKKDKIGERIVALQKLVSPFGKSDTASVLQEASGYIKFLHDQIQVLSSPYLTSCLFGNVEDPEYYNLRNRGLCLIPVALTHSIAKSNGADLWAAVNSKSRPTNQ